MHCTSVFVRLFELVPFRWVVKFQLNEDNIWEKIIWEMWPTWSSSCSRLKLSHSGRGVCREEQLVQLSQQLPAVILLPPLLKSCSSSDWHRGFWPLIGWETSELASDWSRPPALEAATSRRQRSIKGVLKQSYERSQTRYSFSVSLKGLMNSCKITTF